MPTAYELLKQGKHQELWDMCCGFLSLDIDQFMEIQERLLLEQIDTLSNSTIGQKLFRGKRIQSIEEFRNIVPLTTYKDYCPELLEKREETLPEKPSLWAHSSGWSGDYPFKWIPLSQRFAHELSAVLYGVGILSCCNDWYDVSKMSLKNKILFSVAPKPYISGVFADLLKLQIPIDYLPPQEEAEKLSFEDRISMGFKQAVSQGFEYFFGLSLVLVKVGEKLKESSNKTSLRPFLHEPKALLRLAKGRFKSKIDGRPMLPKDLWDIKGIIGSGTDSFIFRDRINELWGRKPLDLYACTEAGVIACQTWDHEGMTFVPNLNFLEFIPEDEQLKNAMDRSYQPQTVLLNELTAGESYEIVITNFHGGTMMRYRVGDMIRLTSPKNNKIGINLPQMLFERRVDDYIDMYVVRLTEKSIWQAIESTGVLYKDWIAFKDIEKQELHISIELKDNEHMENGMIAELIRSRLLGAVYEGSESDALGEMADFRVKVELLPKGTFDNYIRQMQDEGADIAHLKTPHMNPSQKALSVLTRHEENILA